MRLVAEGSPRIAAGLVEVVGQVLVVVAVAKQPVQIGRMGQERSLGLAVVAERREAVIHGFVQVTVSRPDNAKAFAGLEVLLDGLIANGKFCCVRRVRLSLSWLHRPLRLRGSALQEDVALAGERDDPDLDRVPAARSASRRRAPVGSGLPVAGAVGRRRRPAGSDADRRGGA
jgi:hypothetical protein